MLPYATRQPHISENKETEVFFCGLFHNLAEMLDQFGRQKKRQYQTEMSLLHLQFLSH